MKRILLTGTGRRFYQEKRGDDVNTQYGLVKGEDIDKAKDGSLVKSHTGENFVVISPGYNDEYKRIRREAQIITFKDAGVILATAGLGRDTVVAEAGSGSGALTCFLARHCKLVYSYDIDDEHLSVAKENAKRLGLKNIKFRKYDVSRGWPDRTDCLILDVPEPWHTLKHLDNLAIGGTIVTYVPSTVQLQHIHEVAVEAGLLHTRTAEVAERHWLVRGDAVRPTSRNVAFTGFLSFFRYLGKEWPKIRPKDRQPSDGPALPSEEAMQELF